MCEDMGGGSSGRGDLLTQACILRKLFFVYFSREHILENGESPYDGKKHLICTHMLKKICNDIIMCIIV